MAKSLWTIPTKIHLNEVHGKIEQNFGYTSDESVAKELQLLLQELKDSQRQADSTWNWIRREANTLLARNGNKSLFLDYGGEPFEKEMVALTETLLNMARSHKVTSEDLKETFSDKQGLNINKRVNSWVGPMYLGIKNSKGEDIRNIPDAIARDFLTAVGQSQEKIIKNKKNELAISHKNYLDLSAKQGHVDFDGTKSSMVIDINLRLSNKFMRLAQILTNYRFSLKNYRSFGYGNLWNEIGIDTTNPYKAYATVLSNLGYSNYDINRSFERMFWCNYNLTVKGNSNHSSHGVPLHMGHIQGVYGLMGEGIFNPNAKNQQVDFIIINSPKSNQIYVQSTKELVNQLLKGMDKIVYIDRMTDGKIFGSGGIRISGSNLS